MAAATPPAPEEAAVVDQSELSALKQKVAELQLQHKEEQDNLQQQLQDLQEKESVAAAKSTVDDLGQWAKTVAAFEVAIDIDVSLLPEYKPKGDAQAHASNL